MDRAGRRRLRRMARLCEDYGQRVQLSVFECSVDDMQLDALMARARAVIDANRDSLRVYRLQGGRDKAVRTLGRDGYVDYTQPLLA
jgi:CRISPR-associated protein Cas2